MTPEMLERLIPIVSVLAVFGMPVAIVFMTKYFKLRNRELEVEADLQKKWTEESRRQLEARVASLENAVNAVLQIVAPRSQQPTQEQLARMAQLAEGPPQATPDTAAAATGQRERG